jgi:hypothetical protein
METNFNFNSQVCTSKVQSERLLALGLKKETADMVWTHAYYSTWAATAKENPLYFHEADEDTIPAWSLHRLIEMIGDMFEMQHWLGFNIEKDYDHTIDCIEWLIEDNRFNKEYLEE